MSTTRNLEKEVADYYRENTPLIHKTFGYTYQGFPQPKLLQYANLHSSSPLKVADLGSGFGGPSRYILRQYPSVRSITSVNKCLEQLKLHQASLRDEEKARCALVYADYHHTTLQDNEFDRVLFLESLEHSYDLPQAMKEAYRILRPGGQLFIKGWFSEYPREKWNAVTFAIERANACDFHDLHQLVDTIHDTKFTGVKILPSCSKGYAQRGDWLHTFNDPKVELLSTTFPVWDHMPWLRHAITLSGDGVLSKTAYGRLALRGLDLNWLMQLVMNGPTKKSGFTYNHYVLVATKS